MTDQTYNIEPRKLLRQVLPTFLRQPLLLCLMDSALRPLLDLCRYFSALRLETNYKLGHTGQVCSLRSALNDTFDSELRRIEIEDVQRKEYVLFYPHTDNKPVVFSTPQQEGTGPVFFNSAEIGVGAVDFVVCIPAAILSEETIEKRIQNTLNYYKLVSKRYTLKKI